MIEYLKYKRNLKKLRNRQVNILKKLQHINSLPQTQDNYAEVSSLYQEEEKITYWINYLQTKYYCNKCQNLLIPIPNHSNQNLYEQYNFDDEFGDRFIFTNEGFYHIRKLIRNERKEKREAFGFWTTIIIGILGALTGLIAVIMDKK